MDLKSVTDGPHREWPGTFPSPTTLCTHCTLDKVHTAYILVMMVIGDGDGEDDDGCDEDDGGDDDDGNML